MCVCVKVYIMFQKLGMEQENIILPCNSIISTCINISMFLFGNYKWKTFKIKIFHLLTLPSTSTNVLTSNINPTLTTAGSTTDNKGKQPQVLTSRKRNVNDRKKL